MRVVFMEGGRVMKASRKFGVFGLVFLILVFLGSIQLAMAIDLESVRQAILQKNGRWQAGDTSVSKLPPERMKNLVGLIIEGRSAPPAEHLQALPSHFDWRDFGMVTSVKNQGNCGSCWAFGSVAELESLLLINSISFPGGSTDGSEQFLVSYNLSNSGCDGGTLSRAASFLKKRGDIPEACLPYRANDRKIPLPCREWKALKAGIQSWKGVARDVDSLKAAVYENPIVAGMYVYEDFMYYTGGVYEHTTGELLGGHAILIIGWDDADQCFIAKNSWGEDWGESGYFRIAYSQVTNEVQFGTDAIDYDGLWSAD